MTVTPGGSSPVVDLRGVTVDYGGHLALDGLDLVVATGERVALVGPSGAGKTTALSLCNGLVRATSGTVSVLGQDLAMATAGQQRDVRRRVGMVYQQLHLVGPLRVVHNVNAGRLGSWSRHRALRSLLRPVELDSTRAVLARVGIGDKIFERVDRLSGGERQRVALARALRQDPDLLLADEPVSSLDPARSQDVLRLLCEVTDERRRSLIVSLHDFDLARRWCDRLVGLRRGRVVFDLPAPDVTDGIGRDLYQI